MPAHRKTWVYRSGMNNPKFSTDPVHGVFSCTGCHGGNDAATTREAAHAGVETIPGVDKCGACHTNASALAASSLHVNATGYEHVLAKRGFNLGDATSRGRFEKQCTKCHTKNAAATAKAACGQCHVSVPAGAGGGLVAGHRMSRTPDMVNNCTACHGSRIKDEYFGSNQAILSRNSAVMPAGFPHRGDNTTLKPDVHMSGGMDCTACHNAGEMHGSGAGPGMDRYGITGRTQCVDCHVPSNITFHLPMHLEAMACQVCHSQPYKNCYSCHTQETSSGLGFFTNNGSDPTRAARRVPPAWSATVTYAAGAFVTHEALEYKALLGTGNLNKVPGAAGSETFWVAQNAPLPAGDALITFRVGNNPRFGTAPGEKKYAVLRHVPVDANTFTYTEQGTQVPGLLPNLAASPTWKYATPHNIQRRTKITTDPDGPGPKTVCANCHSADYANFWLTDSVADSFGWAGAWETEANAGVVKTAPIAPPLP